MGFVTLQTRRSEKDGGEGLAERAVIGQHYYAFHIKASVGSRHRGSAERRPLPLHFVALFHLTGKV